MEEKDIRWVQRFINYRKALFKMTQAVRLVSENIDRDDDIDDLLEEGLIQRFEYTHELAWNVMKDYEVYQGYTDIHGSRDAIRKALQIGIIDNELWMKSIVDRNLTSHDYDDETADTILDAILSTYYPLFVEFEKKMLPLSGLEPTLF